jgi:hypothetical protein
LSSRAEVRDKVRGVYGFSSLVKQNKKGENYAVFCFAGFFFFNFLCYEVIVKQKIYKRFSNYYSRGGGTHKAFGRHSQKYAQPKLN